MGWKVIGRHKHLIGVTITESAHVPDLLINGISKRRFTATIRGWRNWKLYEGPAPGDDMESITALAQVIRERIDAGDESVFCEGAF